MLDPVVNQGNAQSVMILSILLFVRIIPSVILDYRCAHPISPRNSFTKISSAEGFRKEFQGKFREIHESKESNSTEILTSVGLHETICYTFDRVIQDEEFGFHETTEYEFLMELTSVEEVYPVKEKYNFSIPRVRTRCQCDCPGGRDYCSSSGGDMSRDMSRDCDGGVCADFFRADQTVAGCTITLGQSQMCCKSEFIPLKGSQGISQLQNDQELFTAVKLGDPILVATISQKLFNVKTAQMKYHNVRRIPLNQLHQMADKFRIVLHLRTDTKPLLATSRWYFGPVHNASDPESKVLYTGSDVNSRDEWDVRKLGWFKQGSKKGLQIHRALAASKMSGSVNHCGNQDMDFELDVLYTNNFPVDARDITTVLGVKSANYRRLEDSVVVSRRQAPRVEVALTLKENLEVELSKDESFVGRFSAHITVIEESDVILEVMFFEGSGSIEGEFYSNRNESSINEKFFIYLSENEERISRFVKLSSPCQKLRSEVCFKPFQTTSSPICKIAECIIEPKTLKPRPQEIRTYLPISLPKWTQYLSPVEWINGMDSSLEIVLMCITMGLCAFIVICFIKLCTKLSRS